MKNLLHTVLLCLRQHWRAEWQEVVCKNDENLVWLETCRFSRKPLTTTASVQQEGHIWMHIGVDKRACVDSLGSVCFYSSPRVTLQTELAGCEAAQSPVMKNAGCLRTFDHSEKCTYSLFEAFCHAIPCRRLLCTSTERRQECFVRRCMMVARKAAGFDSRNQRKARVGVVAPFGRRCNDRQDSDTLGGITAAQRRRSPASWPCPTHAMCGDGRGTVRVERGIHPGRPAEAALVGGRLTTCESSLSSCDERGHRCVLHASDAPRHRLPTLFCQAKRHAQAAAASSRRCLQ